MDPRYVRLIIRHFWKENGEKFEKILPYHICTEEDYDQFYPSSKQSEDVINQIRKDSERGFVCIDGNFRDL